MTDERSECTPFEEPIVLPYSDEEASFVVRILCETGMKHREDDYAWRGIKSIGIARLMATLQEYREYRKADVPSE